MSELALQPKQVGADLLLLLQALVLNFEKEISLAEDVLVLLRDRSAFRIVALPSSASHSSPLRQPEKPIRPLQFSARYFLLTRGLR